VDQLYYDGSEGMGMNQPLMALSGDAGAGIAMADSSRTPEPEFGLTSSDTNISEATQHRASGARVTLFGWNWKTNIASDRSNRTEFHVKQINYKDADGQWKPIDVTPVPSAYGWEVSQAPFTARFPKRSIGTAVMVNSNRFDVPSGTDITESDQTMTIIAEGVADVEGILEYGDVGYGPEWYVRYPQAYPAQNADLIFLVWQGKVPRLQKLIRFNSTLTADTDFSFVFGYPTKDPDFKKDAAKWNKETNLLSSSGLAVGNDGSKRGFGFKDFKIWDSAAGSGRKFSPVQVDIEKKGGSYVLTKHIPASFFASAVFPVYTDTTNTFYPDPHVETTTFDAYTMAAANDPYLSWSGLIAADGTHVQDSSSPIDLDFYTASYAPTYGYLRRGVFLFDTSTIGSGNAVDSATVSFYPSEKNIRLDPYWNVASLITTASNTAATASDHNRSNWNMSNHSDTSIKTSNWNLSGYGDFALNTTGRSAIALTGITRLGLTTTADISGTSPGSPPSLGWQGIQVYSAESSGTSKDPKLVVNWHYAAPLAPSNLLTDGETNPTLLLDRTPKFSAIYNDQDSGDTSTSYQLQVSTSSTNWNTPVWDSGKTAMAATTQGTRSPDITFGGTPLALDGSTYYWRIKFWDIERNEGQFSTSTASFSMVADAAPTAPTDLLVNGQVDPTSVTSASFGAVYNDPDIGDVANAYRIQISSSSTDWSSPVWDTGETAMASTTRGSRSPDIAYGGMSLPLDGSTYWWRIKFWDKYGEEGQFSTSTASFTMYAPPSAFVSSIDGELVQTDATSVYAARVENGTFNTYTYSDGQWIVKDKNGTQYTYGSVTSTRQDDPSDSTHVYKWMLEEVRDTNDNYISYSYYKNAGQIYPESITYTGHGSSDGIFEIDFLRESRVDSATSWHTGFPVASNSRISEIDAKVNGTLVHKYVLSYGTSANGGTSLLGSVTETGYDEASSPVTLPATTFTYASNTPGWTNDPTWYSPEEFNHQSVDNSYQIVDVNGDGLPDIMRSFYTYPNYYDLTADINNGHGWTADHTWDLPVHWIYEGYLQGYMFVDVNGDHLPDIVLNDSSNGVATYINSGHGWTFDSNWNLPVAISANGTLHSPKFVDLNGDGLVDLLVSDAGGSYAYVNNGSGWTYDADWLSPVQFFGSQDNDYQVIDVNGDGLPDILRNADGSYDSYINNGHGWTQDHSWDLPVNWFSSGSDQGYMFVDVNGDRLPDIVYGSYVPGVGQYYDTYINNGHGWTLDANWNLPTFITTWAVQRGAKFADVNGDSVYDLLVRNETDNEAYIAHGKSIDLLTEITHPSGGKTGIQFKQMGAYLDAAGALTNTSVPFSLNTVYKISTSDGSTTSTLDTYSYRGGKFQCYSPFDKKFAAFAEIDKTDNAGNVTKTFYHTGGGTDSARGEFQDNFWKIGRAYRVEKYDDDGTLFEKTVNKWDTATSSTSISGFVKLAQTVDFAYDGQSIHRDKGESYTYDDVTGNMTQKVEWGEVTGSDDGSFTDIGSDKLTMDISYASSASSGVIGAVSVQTVTDQDNAKVKESRFYYDDLALGEVGKGNQTKKEDHDNGCAIRCKASAAGPPSRRRWFVRSFPEARAPPVAWCAAE
jgi:VCBS repeat protein/virulence plasmid B protein